MSVSSVVTCSSGSTLDASSDAAGVADAVGSGNGAANAAAHAVGTRGPSSRPATASVAMMSSHRTLLITKTSRAPADRAITDPHSPAQPSVMDGQKIAAISPTRANQTKPPGTLRYWRPSERTRPGIYHSTKVTNRAATHPMMRTV